MFGMDQSETQGEQAPSPEGLPTDVIISPDARRAGRIPPGQSRTRKWPILDASGPPFIDLNTWRFPISGLSVRQGEFRSRATITRNRESVSGLWIYGRRSGMTRAPAPVTPAITVSVRRARCR